MSTEKILKSCFIVIISIIIVFNFVIWLNGPMIKGNIYIKMDYSNIKGMNIKDCKKITELMNNELDIYRKDFFKMERNKCRRLYAMLSLEYCIVYINCIFGFICCIIGFLDTGAAGGFGVLSSIIGFVLTLVYTIYNGYILHHDSPSYIEYNDLIKMSTKTLILFNTPIEPITYAHPKNELIKTDSNGIYANYDKSLQRYKLKFSSEENGDIYASYAKYKDLYLSAYNFNKTLYIKKNMIIITVYIQTCKVLLQEK